MAPGGWLVEQVCVSSQGWLVCGVARLMKVVASGQGVPRGSRGSPARGRLHKGVNGGDQGGAGSDVEVIEEGGEARVESAKGKRDKDTPVPLKPQPHNSGHTNKPTTTPPPGPHPHRATPTKEPPAPQNTQPPKEPPRTPPPPKGHNHLTKGEEESSPLKPHHNESPCLAPRAAPPAPNPCLTSGCGWGRRVAGSSLTFWVVVLALGGVCALGVRGVPVGRVTLQGCWCPLVLRGVPGLPRPGAWRVRGLSGVDCGGGPCSGGRWLGVGRRGGVDVGLDTPGARGVVGWWGGGVGAGRRG